MVRVMVLAVAAALALAACGQQGQQRAEGEKSDAQPLATTANSIANIGPGGAAGISTALPMDLDTVRAAAPNFVAVEVDDQVEGNAFRAITLSARDQEVFRILPDPDRTHVHAIVTRSAQARGPAGEVVGVTTFGAAPPDDVSFCLTEFVDGEPGFSCSTAADGRFWRVYRLPEGAAAAETFEEIEPDLLHEAMLAEMRWIAPRV